MKLATFLPYLALWVSGVMLGAVLPYAAWPRKVRNQISRLLYRYGYRPKPGSAFYSPGSHWIWAYRDAVKKLSYPVIIQLPTPKVSDDGPA